jgi:hypothetical protein
LPSEATIIGTVIAVVIADDCPWLRRREKGKPKPNAELVITKMRSFEGVQITQLGRIMLGCRQNDRQI